MQSLQSLPFAIHRGVQKPSSFFVVDEPVDPVLDPSVPAFHPQPAGAIELFDHTLLLP